MSTTVLFRVMETEFRNVVRNTTTVKRITDVIAVFPEEIGTFNQNECLSYARVGQHGICDLPHIIANSRPAAYSEYLALKNELETLIGYDDLYIWDDNRVAAVDMQYWRTIRMGKIAFSR